MINYAFGEESVLHYRRLSLCLEKINLLAEANRVEKLYVYEKIGKLNGHTLSVVNVENRTLDFHVHEDSDELFYVIEGSFQLETKDGLTKVNAAQFIGEFDNVADEDSDELAGKEVITPAPGY